MVDHNPDKHSVPDFNDAIRVWAKIGCLSFGGPAAQIALMHKMIVEERNWLSEKQFLGALNFCMLLPGPEAMQLATYSGWRMHGVLGGLAAGLLFVMPGALVILVLSALYAGFGEVPLMQSLFLGIKAAVIIVVIEALLKVSKRALNGKAHYAIAFLAFVAMFAFSIPFPVVIVAAALFGLLASDQSTCDADVIPIVSVSFSQTVKTIAVWLLVWLFPVALLWVLGADRILIDLSLFFSKLAVVTFGGAYAVLAYMAQDVVSINGWLTAEEMVDGLGLAETTPGPLILVTEFVGFLAAEKTGGFWLGLTGAIVTLWVTFAPCFLWIFAGAPYIEWISAQPRLRGALAAITAAVVGVILNLALWFVIHVFFNETRSIPFGFGEIISPVFQTLDWGVVALAIVSGLLLLRFKLNLILVLGVSAMGGLVLSLAGL